MSTCSQYRTSLSYNANLFLHLHPEGAAMLDGLKADMVELQQQVRPALWSQAGTRGPEAGRAAQQLHPWGLSGGRPAARCSSWHVHCL